MKKALSLLLVASLLLSTVLMLTSCLPSDDGIQTDDSTVSLDMSDYVLVYGSELTKGGKDAAALLAAELKYLTGTKISAWIDHDDAENADECEILIGETSRPESAEALNRIQGSGWIICVIGQKLVIAGTSAFLTRVALNHFSDTYIKEEAVDGTVLNVHKEIIHANLSTVTLEIRSDLSTFDIVYDDRIDDYDNGGKDNYDYGSDANPTTGGPDADYTYKYTLQTVEKLAGMMNVDVEAFPLKDDSADATSLEILIGNMDGRADYVNEMKQIAANEYGVAIRNNKIMLLAWNDVTLSKTAAILEEILKGCQISEGGKVKFVIPNDCILKELHQSYWETAFPKPEGENILLRGVQDIGNDSLEYIYIGDGADSNGFTAYCAKLEAADYRTIHDEWNIDGNRFRTYVNETAKITLHVSYTHYKHAQTDGLPGIRIVAASTDRVDLPTAEMLSSTQYDAESYQKVISPKITQLKLAYSAGSFGNAYIITLADGSFIVYDGGRGYDDDVANLWTALNALYKEAFGTEPTASNPIHIRAWILSHEHSDHFTVFREFCKEYGKYDELRFDALLFNPVSASERTNSNNPESAIQNNMATIKGYVNGGFDFIKMHTGQTFYFVNVKVEVLYTHEDTYPRGLEYFNNSSTIFRTTMKSYSKTNATTQTTMMWLGDAERIAGNRLMALYGSNLDSDMVQVAHHGWCGVSYECYQLIAPEVVWWPTSHGNFKSWTKASNSGKKWFYAVDHKIAYELYSVKLILVADTYNTTMTFDGSGNEWTTLYDLINGADIVYTTSLTGGTVMKK